ncbi:Vacuolar protein sorting-associated protein 13B [Bienertia sinuspersici]
MEGNRKGKRVRLDNMFGRIRSSPSPAELLELERPPSKFFKDDSLSIYEATLVKLKQGSQRSTTSEHDLSPTLQDSMESELNSNSNSLESSPQVFGSGSNSSCLGVLSSPNQEQRRGRDISIYYLFSKYASSHQNQGSTSYGSDGSSANTSACSSDSELTGRSRLKL